MVANRKMMLAWLEDMGVDPNTVKSFTVDAEKVVVKKYFHEEEVEVPFDDRLPFTNK